MCARFCGLSRSEHLLSTVLSLIPFLWVIDKKIVLLASHADIQNTEGDNVGTRIFLFLVFLFVFFASFLMLLNTKAK